MFKSIKLDRDGVLHIYRNKWKLQSCPYKEESCCGDWCPLFGEEERFTTEELKQIRCLKVCETTLFSEEFIDERK